MSVNNTPIDLGQVRYLRVRAAFVSQGTTLNAWCKANGSHIQNVRDAFFGKWKGERAAEMVARIVVASGVTEP